MNKDFMIGKIKKMFNEKMIESYSIINQFHNDRFPMSWGAIERVGLTIEGSIVFNELVDDIMKSKKIRRCVNRKEINSYLKTILSRLLELDKVKLLKEIIKEVNSIEKNLISLKENVEMIFPILNLKLNRRYLIIGNVKIFNFSSYQLKRELKFRKQLMINNPHYKDEPNEIHGWMKHFKESFEKEYLNKVCVKVDSYNSPKKNYEDVIKKIEISLACIKLFSNHIHIGNNCQFGLVGSVVKGDMLGCLIKYKDGKGCKTDGGFVGYVYSFDIDDEFINKANIDGLRILDRILKKSERNEIENRILNFIYWYAKSYDVSLVEYQKNKKNHIKDVQLNILSHEIGEKFLKLVICLESLLLFRGFNENKKKYLKQRSSFLLLCTKKDKKGIQKFIEESYNIRNKIVHEGYVDLSYSQLIQLDFYVKTMIKNLIKNYKRWNINSNIDLYKWFEKKRLSSI